MPYRTFDIEEVARYLRMESAEVERLVKDQEIPFERRGQRLVFRKVAIDSWASPRILGLSGRRLEEYHRGAAWPARHARTQPALLPELLKPEFIEPALPAKTKASVIREMAALAQRTGRVWDVNSLRAGLEDREELSSTGLPGGLALLHTRSQESTLFEAGFILLGRTVQPIPFGAPDGRPTDLFFLVACPDQQDHLHTLARLCLMAHKTELLVALRSASDAATMYCSLLAAEESVL